MMKTFICSAGSVLICERTILFAEKMEVNQLMCEGCNLMPRGLVSQL